MKTTTFIAALFLACSTLYAQQPSLSDIDTFVGKVMKEFEVPGVSLAIVKDGKVVAAKGYGIRKLGASAPVDERTLFGIASNTKAFTATALGMLVEEGKLEWDAPVINYLPWFQLSDPYVTRELTIRDLLVHRSGLGLGAGDLLWWPYSTYTRKEIAHRLRSIPLSTSFRSAYAYDNVLYLVAGEVVEAVTGQSWEDFVGTRIVKRIGMSQSTVTCNFPRDGNVATTHAKVDGRLQIVQPDMSSNTSPARGIHSNAVDMAKWMIVQLDSGKLADGSRLFSPKTTRQLWSLVTPIPIGNPSPELEPLRANFNGYALGFGIRDYRGHKTVSHTGGLPGYVSRVFMIPDRKLGIAVLTNQESGDAFNAIVYFIVDRYLNVPKHDWLAAYKRSAWRRDSTNLATEQAARASRDSTSRPSLPLAKYAGTYRDPWYGAVQVDLEDGVLVMKFSHTPLLTGNLEHYQFNTFIARWHSRELRADAYVTFDLDEKGLVDEVKMKPASPEVDFSFDFQDLRLKPVASK